VDHFILDEGGWCYENERDKIFLRTGLGMNLVKLRTLK
jgi:hypothetical protein